MKLKILGSISPYAKKKSKCSGYVVYDENDKILLDCGFGITSNMNFPEDLENLSIIISHYHKDHYADLFAIGYASVCYYRQGILTDKINVYIPKVQKNEKGYIDYELIKAFDDYYFKIQEYETDSIIRINNNVISFFETRHSIPNRSIKVENSNYKIVYTGDMGYFNIDKYSKFCQNADILISESTYLESDNTIDRNHLHAKEAANIAKLSTVGLLILSHMWPEHDKNNYLQEAKLIFDNTIVAEDNLKINLNKL